MLSIKLKTCRLITHSQSVYFSILGCCFECLFSGSGKIQDKGRRMFTFSLASPFQFYFSPAILFNLLQPLAPLLFSSTELSRNLHIDTENVRIQNDGQQFWMEAMIGFFDQKQSHLLAVFVLQLLPLLFQGCLLAPRQFLRSKVRKVFKVIKTNSMSLS